MTLQTYMESLIEKKNKISLNIIILLYLKTWKNKLNIFMYKYLHKNIHIKFIFYFC